MHPAKHGASHPSTAGLTAEDLWNLPLTSRTKANLDDIAKAVYRELTSLSDVTSFVSSTTDSVKKAVLEAKLDLVKHVIAAKIEANQAAAAIAERAAKKQRLLEALDRSENKALEQLTPEQIRDQIAAL